MICGKVVERFQEAGKEIVFRYPRLEDVDGLLQLINTLVAERAMLSVQKKKTRKAEVEWLSDLLRKVENKETVVLVVEIGREIMGSAQVEREGEPSSHTAELGISLRKEMRGKGIGKKLFEEIIKEAKKVFEKITIIKLRVMGNNEVAQSLYRKCGFQEAGRIKRGLRYYERWVDDVTMVKYL